MWFSSPAVQIVIHELEYEIFMQLVKLCQLHYLFCSFETGTRWVYNVLILPRVLPNLHV